MATSESERQARRASEFMNMLMAGDQSCGRWGYRNTVLHFTQGKEYYKTDSYRDVLSNLVLQKQAKLNAGNTANKLAALRETDIQYLRHLAEQVDCKPGYAPAYDDAGFRGPGKAQFLAALYNYQAGTPRNYEEPSCFNCGKDCQTSHWRDHKSLSKSGRAMQTEGQSKQLITILRGSKTKETTSCRRRFLERFPHLTEYVYVSPMLQPRRSAVEAQIDQLPSTSTPNAVPDAETAHTARDLHSAGAIVLTGTIHAGPLTPTIPSVPGTPIDTSASFPSSRRRLTGTTAPVTTEEQSGGATAG
ncbi:MYND finger domain-containing protein [Colletotrichum musicola]|uniref:MYND finger domain-containing protein n=1 Tax=Colletotrichum musicola TaxID=2175873 RepID=A0A8H6KBT3_9PEZI|nr:MYND finger domain-containing protein [Colletotrichum musicola]